MYVGPEGSGHFIKMVHNGIEYVEMQLLAEVSTILEALGQNPDEISNTLETWKSSASSCVTFARKSITHAVCAGVIMVRQRIRPGRGGIALQEEQAASSAM